MIGYIVQDEDCQNPMDDCDGMGRLLNKTRDGRDEKEIFSEAGLDSYGNLEEEEENRGTPNPYAVLLDYREHGPGSGQWSIDDPLCSRLADIETAVEKADGLWIPKNDCDVSEIESRIAAQCFKPSLTFEQLKELHDPPTSELIKKLTPEVLIEYVESCLEPLNSWLENDCWGVCFDEFDEKDERVEEDACWGFIGHDYALSEVKDGLDCREKHVLNEKSAPSDSLANATEVSV